MTLRRYAPPAGLILLLLVGWEVFVTLRAVPTWILPPPTAIVKVTWDNLPLLMPHITQTVRAMAIGVGVALVAGVGLAGLMDMSPFLRRVLYPILVTSQTIPILVLAPLLIIWFGFGLMPKVVIVALFCFFPIAINTADGLTAADPEWLALLHSMGANRFQIWRQVRLPAAMPYFFSGLRIAVTYSIAGAIVGEWVGASEGLGIYMLRSANAFRTEQVFSAVMLSTLLSLGLFGLVVLVEQWTLPWYHSAQRQKQWT